MLMDEEHPFPSIIRQWCLHRPMTERAKLDWVTALACESVGSTSFQVVLIRTHKLETCATDTTRGLRRVDPFPNYKRWRQQQNNQQAGQTGEGSCQNGIETNEPKHATLDCCLNFPRPS